MIRIELTDDDFSRTRLALSPLWELVASLFLLHRADPPPEQRAWVERTRGALAERHRVRRRVFYGLNDTGASLLVLLTEIPAALSA